MDDFGPGMWLCYGHMLLVNIFVRFRGWSQKRQKHHRGNPTKQHWKLNSFVWFRNFQKICFLHTCRTGSGILMKKFHRELFMTNGSGKYFNILRIIPKGNFVFRRKEFKKDWFVKKKLIKNRHLFFFQKKLI